MATYDDITAIARLTPTALQQPHGSGIGDCFTCDFMAPNRPVVITECLTRDWPARRVWLDADGAPDLDALSARFGSATVPVTDCDSQCCTTMRFADFARYWRDRQHDGRCASPATRPLLYLKDWHMARRFPDHGAYATPALFRDDWMPGATDADASDDDHRFVYMGPAGSWTPLHADVLRSYSWSSNVCGTKRWILLPPDQAPLLLGMRGRLPTRVDDDAYDRHEFPQLHRARRIEVLQGPGETIFVPSGWYHQVHNLTDAISINHNWFNAYNVHHVWRLLQDDLRRVCGELEDCRAVLERCGEWSDTCESMLRANSGFSMADFAHLIVRRLDAAAAAFAAQRPDDLRVRPAAAFVSERVYSVLHEMVQAATQFGLDGTAFAALADHAARTVHAIRRSGNYREDSVACVHQPGPAGSVDLEAVLAAIMRSR